MQAFHNEPAIKDFFLARIATHRAADEIRHGYYWENGKGCAVGCTLHSSSHTAYETKLGIPYVLAHLEDDIFEGLPSPEDQQWPQAFLAAIPVGADLSLVWPRFFLRIATDIEHGLLRHVQAAKHTRQKEAIEKVIQYYEKWVIEKKKPAAAAYTAAYAAYAAAAAAYAAYAAAAAAADAADAATEKEWQTERLFQYAEGKL